MNKLTELKAAHAKMGAEIKKLELEPEPRGVWQPKEGESYSYANGMLNVHHSERENWQYSRHLAYHNVYQTELQAQKAAVLTRQSNRIIQACIHFDPDFMPDWSDGSWKYSVWYSHGTNCWEVTSVRRIDSRPAYVSPNTIAQSICDMFNAEERES